MPETPVGSENDKHISRVVPIQIGLALVFAAIAVLSVTFFFWAPWIYCPQQIEGSYIIPATYAVLFFGLMLIWLPLLRARDSWDTEDLVKNQTKATMGILILFTVLAGTVVLADALKSRGSSPENASPQPKQAAGDAKGCPAVTVQVCPGAAAEAN